MDNIPHHIEKAIKLANDSSEIYYFSNKQDYSFIINKL